MNDPRNELPVSQRVAQVLMQADRPLTAEEVMARVELFGPLGTRDPLATVRQALSQNRLIATLGGRPAHHAWWPHHLTGATFRQPLASSDLQTGTLVLAREVRYALWPGFHAGAGSRGEGDVTLELAGGPPLQGRIEHLVDGEPVWGLAPSPALASWYAGQRLTVDDDLIVHVLDGDAHRAAVTPARRVDRPEAAVAARNREMGGVAESVLRTARPRLPDFDLIPRLIARDAYRDPLPPDPWEQALRPDLRFLVEVRRGAISLVEQVVDRHERDVVVRPDLHARPRPRGNRQRARSEEARRAWGDYLFDRGMDHNWAGLPWAAEAYYREALRLDAGHADAWVHLGNRRFAEGQVEEALAHYQRGQAAAEARTVGDPARYPHPFWLDLDSRPFMRALHGRGLSLWRLGRVGEARAVFARMLELNPGDNQGARFLLADLDAGLTWEQSAALDEVPGGRAR